MQALICDIDGTLADLRHRLHHVLPGGKRDWGAFFAKMDGDSIIEPVRAVVCAMKIQGHPVLLCSGRPTDYAQETIAWLRRHGIPYDRLYMRAEGDVRADHIVKAELLANILADGFDPLVVIDDRDSVVAMWREHGLLCLQAAPCEVEVPFAATLTLMVGPSGAGKSTWLRGEEAQERGIRISQVIASDDVRMDLTGDFRDQTRNAEVFSAVHAMATARLRRGLPTVIDATHLRRKDRMSAVALVPAISPVLYVVVDRPMEAKRATAGWRAELPIDLLERHAQSFRSQLTEILAGDHLPNVTVLDRRA